MSWHYLANILLSSGLPLCPTIFFVLDTYHSKAISGRKQWSGFKGSPATFFATGTFYAEEYRTQGGIKILKDKIGYINTLYLALSYAYMLPVRHDSWINFGIAGSYQTQSIDRSKIIAGNDNAPILLDEILKGLKQWNAAIRIEYTYARYRTRYLGRSNEAGRYRTLSIPRSYGIDASNNIKTTFRPCKNIPTAPLRSWSLFPSGRLK